MMQAFKSFLRRLRRNALVFLLTFVTSVAVTNLLPHTRDAGRRLAQYQLHQAAAAGKAKTVKALLFAGANARGTSPTYSPVHVAARNGHTEVVRILLDNGADVNSLGDWQQTPLVESVWGGHLGVAKVLLSRGATLSREGKLHGTALWQAHLADQTEMIRLLMRHGGRNCADAESVLTAAVEDNHTEAVKALLEGGVDPRDVTATPLVLPLTEVAAQKGNIEMVMLLKQAGAK